MRREGRPAARLFAALGGVGGCDGRCLFVGACGAGAVARLPRAANRRWCGRCELCRCGVCRACALCSWGRARAVQAVAGRSGERVWGVAHCGGANVRPAHTV